nr:hypothetical protein KPHV_83690 [Kitasatospora purpeofusca]
MSRDALVSKGEPAVTQEVVTTLPDGRPVTRWTIGSPEGLTAEVLDLGARLQALHAPDRYGRRANVVLGCDDVEDLLGEAAYLGASIGRYGNRIADGLLSLDGTEYGSRPRRTATPCTAARTASPPGSGPACPSGRAAGRECACASTAPTATRASREPSPRR